MTSDDPQALVDTFLSPPFTAEPYPVYDRLRDVAPVFHSESAGLWFASDYESCEGVFRSPSFGQGVNAGGLRDDPRFAQSPALQVLANMMVFLDPPDHSRLRRILSPYFTPRAIEAMRVFTAGLVDRLLGDFARDGGGDLVDDYARNIPVAVVCQMLGGMGEEDQERCQRWSDGLVEAVHPVVTDEMLVRADAAASGFSEYVRGLVERARAGGDSGMLGALVAEHDAGVVSDDELLAQATILVGAAFHNTKNHIAMGIWTLVRNPDQLDLLRADPRLARPAAEELLRYEPPVQLTLPRVAFDDVELGDHTIPAGDQVIGVIGGAHRDPARYEDPTRLDITRTDGGSLALAQGIHSCLGAAMARLEGEIAIESFVRRFPRITLLDEEPEVDVAGLPLTRGFRAIRVEVSGK
jgi:cytochrome P450